MVKNSITAKLLIAFGAMALLSLFAAGVGIFGFERISATQNSIINKAIPVLKNAHSLAQMNARISALAQRLLDVRTKEDYDDVSESLRTHMLSFRALLDRLEDQDFAGEYLDPIDSVFDRINLLLGKQNELVAKRLEVRIKMAELVERLIFNTTQLNELTDSLVANAASTTTAVASSLYDLVEAQTPSFRLYGVFDRLIEVDIDEMERMFELRLRSSNLSAVVSQVAKETDQDQINALKGQASEVMSILERRVNEINDPQRKFKAQTLLRSMRLDSGPLNTLNLFKLRESQLEVESSLSDFGKLYRIEAAKLNSIVSGLSNSSGAMMGLATKEAESSLQESRRMFIFITILALTLILLILWRYVHVNVIRRLLSLKDATVAIVQGKLNYTIDNKGNDEIAHMADALVLFRENAQEKKNLDQELQNYKNNLEKTVNYRTNQLKLANEKLENEVAEHAIAREKAEQANRAKTEFMATISHELRTPLSGALGTLNLLHATGLTPKQREYLNAIDTANSVLLDILDNVLGYSQVKAGKIAVEQKAFNLHDLMNNVINVMTAAARQQKSTISLELDENVPYWLKGDSGKLNQILLNLIGNAVKFTYEGVITITVRKIDFGDDKDKIQFEVIDTGIGVSEEKREEIFMAFTQGDSSTARRYGGIGLGLAICKSLVDLLEGSISLYSIMGEGTTVNLILDFEPCDAPSSLSISGESAALASPVLPPQRVLLVEDDETNRLVVKHYLEGLGHDVATANDGDIALSELKTGVFDVVLLDISLPGSDGMTVIKEIRQSEIGMAHHLPVVAMSAHVFHEEVERYLNAGMDGFIGKPFTKDDLEMILSSTLGKMEKEAWSQSTSEASFDNVHLSGSDSMPVELLNEAVVRDDLHVFGTAKFLELIAMYKKSSDDNLQQMRLSLLGDDGESVIRIAHKMRGASGNLGFSKLHWLFREMEIGQSDKDHLMEQILDCNELSIQALDDFVTSITGSQNI